MVEARKKPGIMIEILDEYLNLVYPDMGVKIEIGSKYISGKYYIDDLSLMTGKIEDPRYY